ncbi:MAG: transcriptional repressor LexA [candidate division WOR-3 bacterium]|nr:transcriptional repressor LexA [candidate division WOR-3 bacterium]
MRKELTKKQARILRFIKEFLERNNYPPSYEEIAQHFKMAKPSAFDHLNALQKKGYIRKKHYRARTIELVEKSTVVKEDYLIIPIVGRIAAGQPILAVENIEGNVRLDRDLIKGKDVFALRVKGDSMKDAGIYNGDLVFVRPQSVAEKNDIVAVLIGEEVTLKYYYPKNDTILLIPANKKFPTITIKKGSEEVRILGKVIGLFRRVGR